MSRVCQGLLAGVVAVAFAAAGTLLYQWRASEAPPDAAAAGRMLYEILGRITAAEHRMKVFLLVLSLSALDGTRSVGASLLFSSEFQPSTVSTVGLVAASWLYLRGRYLASGLALAAGSELLI